MGAIASSVQIAFSTHHFGREWECLSCPAVSRSNGSGYELLEMQLPAAIGMWVNMVS